MITQNDISEVIKDYDMNNIRIGSLGGHSALDVCRGAKDGGLETVVVAKRGREKTYSEHYKSDGSKGCVDHVILVDEFADIVKPEIQKQLRELNTVFVHSRYFWVYCSFDEIENEFNVPIIGNRILVRKEERDESNNQYFLLDQAGIPKPAQFEKPENIDRLAFVKAREAARGYERAFFLVNNYEDYKNKSAKLIKDGVITEESLKKAVIEEFAVGPQINFNLFYSPLDDEIELLGTDIRRQTNLDGILRMTANEQIETLKYVEPKYIENGHQAVTVKESLVETAFNSGRSFADAVKQYYPPGMIGPFGLQGVITAGPPKEQFVCFDVSLRIPGSPGTMFTPYTGYLHGENISVGRRIAMEVNHAVSAQKLHQIVT